MKAFLISLIAIVLGLGIGIGTTWQKVVNDHSFFQAEGFTPEQRWPTDEQRDQPRGLPNTAASGRPKLVVVNGEVYDFGEMDVDTSDSHTFILKNEGDAPLRIEKRRTTCKCTVSRLESDLIPPGATIDAKLEWTANEYDDEFRHTAEFVTSDPDRPVVFLEISGRVIQLISAQPEDVVFTDLSNSEPRTTIVSVIAEKYKDLSCTGVELINQETAEFFEVQVEPMSADEARDRFEAESGFHLRLTTKPGLPLGPLRQTIRVLTSAHVSEGMEIPIHGEVVGDINFRSQLGLDTFRNILDVGLVQQAAGRTARVDLIVKGKYRNDVKVSADNDEVDPSDIIQVSMGQPRETASGTARIFPLDLTIRPGSRPINRFGPNANNFGRVIVRTTHPTMKKITLYIRFGIQG